MGVNVFPLGAGGSSPIKSIQRGVAASAGNITISAVDTTKTMVRSFSTGSSGSVAATGTVAAASISGNVGATSMSIGTRSTAVNPVNGNAGWAAANISSGNGNTLTYSNGGLPVTFPTGYLPNTSFAIPASGISANVGATSISGGSTDLTSAEFGVYLTNATTLTATGACRWEVVEFN